MPKEPETTAGRKHCARCGRWKIAGTEFRVQYRRTTRPPFKNKDRAANRFQWEDKWYTGPYIDSICTTCRRVKTKAAVQERFAAMTPQEKKEHRRLKTEQAAAQRKTQRWIATQALQSAKRGERMKRTELYNAVRNVNLVLNKGSGQYNPEFEVPFLPFRFWVLKTLRRMSVMELAETIGRDESQVRRWADGFYWETDGEPRAYHAIELRTVDQIFTNYGRPDILNEVYPFVDEIDYGLDGLDNISE